MAFKIAGLLVMKSAQQSAICQGDNVNFFSKCCSATEYLCGEEGAVVTQCNQGRR